MRYPGCMSLELSSLRLLEPALRHLQDGFPDLPAFATGAELDELAPVLQQVAERMRDNFPYHHPFYAGQMLKPPHPVARLAYMLAMWINPNNHALDGGRASSAMEKEAVAAIAHMFGWREHLGHLCGGGTMANLEALWVAGRSHPGRAILASSQSHYTHSRISDVLGLPFEAVPADASGRMSVAALAARARRTDASAIGTVVATLGTTGLGAIDPLPEILELAREHGFRVHVDAAYGGYFGLADNLSAPTRAAFDRIAEADSIVIDPHKHGLQPYGCGCVLFRDPAVGQIYRHDSPYTYFSSQELHLGEISLECSRAGAAAVALWATQRHLPMEPGGKFAQGLSSSRRAARWLHRHILEESRFLPILEPELDIVVWASAGERASTISQRSQELFDATAARGLHLALIALPAALLRAHWPEVEFDTAEVTCLRSCLMKAEHEGWMERIWARLLESVDACRWPG